MIMVPISDSKALDVSEIQGNISTPFLMPMPIVVGSIYKQYCASHRGADLLRYSALAVELDIIKQSEVLDFFNSDLMIPGGVEFGIYPVAIFVNIVSKLEEICLQFSRGNQPAALDRYQRRALAFCNERMGSYLLLKSLEQICGANIPKEWFGHMHTISDNLTYYGT